MKILSIHADFLEFEPVSKALKEAEEIDKIRKKIEDCLVIFSAVEKDDRKASEKLVEEIINIADQIKARKIVLYPFVHLTSNPADPKIALDVLKESEKTLKEKGYEVCRTPFGWYKKFIISCKGHPLAELSRAIGKEEEKKEEEKPEIKGEKFHKFIVIDIDGKEYEVTRENWEACPLWEKKGIYELMKMFVRNEISKKPGKEFPKHIEYMRKLELVDYCPESDIGNLKWYPDGTLIFDLINDYAFFNIAIPWGAFKIKNPIIYRTSVAEIGKLMGEFHERDYWVLSGEDRFVLRFASDPGGFPFMQKIVFSYKQIPVKIYEEAVCFRREQAGEVVGLARVRNFNMTDMHAFCKDVEQAKKEFNFLSQRFGKLMNEVIGKNWVLGWEGTEDFYNQNKGWLIEIGKSLRIPAFVKLMPEMTHYYTIKNEFQAISPDGSSVQVSTVQWDVKNGERFNICYVDENGKKVPVPVILHASSFGSIERTLWAILENAAWDEKQGRPPMIPLWLSPVQVRMCPISDDYLDLSKQIAEKISAAQIRADVDDRKETVSHKIREAEKRWVPYVLVIGEKEKTGKLQVRIRKTREVKEMTLEQLILEVKEKTRGMPARPSYLPILLSKRPIFIG